LPLADYALICHKGKEIKKIRRRFVLLCLIPAVDISLFFGCEAASKAAILALGFSAESENAM
jgi:hypothetical protein